MDIQTEARAEGYVLPLEPPEDKDGNLLDIRIRPVSDVWAHAKDRAWPLKAGEEVRFRWTDGQWEAL